jgi:hypothetical protein
MNLSVCRLTSPLKNASSLDEQAADRGTDEMKKKRLTEE